MKKSKIEAVLAYQNKNVTDRFIKLYGVEEAEAVEIFEDVKRWLWMAAEAREQGIDQPVVIDRALVVLDEMWHNFMLFTRDYGQFCKDFFGGYIHHSPMTAEGVASAESELDGYSLSERKTALMNKKRWQYEFIYDQLGEHTFMRWYKQYPQRYTSKSLCEMALNTELKRSESLLQELARRHAELSDAA
ncbi:hypothetical protein HWQ46_02625 [Shewanella sp. D64]|uniref:hypothetical protein n=1 Tax=unclassified Shewanella TaxID=196818 RepID=UPI0022BA2865|nr:MULTISPECIES: hypothetical protein [unclassified Shewanella]MEC4724441.1 hypothetical protein [Shewanella sp. D64]MEC4736782.1 hypothetical protein [Shewanella sp. E94]WBJ94555.1 hypothetical protein HWQ47_22265 [Shewanella sp. MTB7]